MAASSPAARRIARTRRSVTEVGSPDHAAQTASSFYQATTVHDRIKGWQTLGAAVALPPDDVSVASVPRSEASVPDFTGKDDGVFENTKEYKNSADRKRKENALTELNQARQSPRVRSSSTPRKRVVSDEHWKAGRNSRPNEALRPKKSTEAVEVTTDDTPYVRAESESSQQKAKIEREERRKRRVDARSRKSSERKGRRHENHQTQNVDVSHLDSELGESTPQPSAQNISIDDGEINSLLSVNEELAFDNDDAYWPMQDEDDQPQTKSKYAETLGRPPPTYQDAQLRSKKGSFFSKTKEALGMTDSIPVPSNRLPSIEAWLDDQPDPFVERTGPRVRFQSEIAMDHKPEHATRKPSKESPKPALRDPNQIWDAIDGQFQAEQNLANNAKKSRMSGSSKVAEEPILPAQASLQRRGAKASRKKSHAARESVVEVDEQLPEHQREPQDKHNEELKTTSDRVCPRTGPTKLSTIASVESLNSPALVEVEGSSIQPNEIDGKVIIHEDLMTQLSRPPSRNGTRRKRSVKITNHSEKRRSVDEILKTLSEDEMRYNRELRTLVDGVIPVLLQCVLSKTDSVAAAEFFTTSVNITNDLSFSRPIIDMGIALEKLKTLHNRIPLNNVDKLFNWCQTAHKAYSDYLKAWRLGFQDVVVNLAPLDGSDSENSEVMGRAANGDIVNSEGEVVDIAYLMKRPLVNIRKLGRTLSDIQEELPDHPLVNKLAEDYRELTASAKTKHQQEKGRLEDEAAASTDSSKCRDIRSMAPLPGVTIDTRKRVRARDCFDMTLFHSSGQRMDCKIELILRDSHQDSPDAGDLLICQIEESGKWLLFAPVELGFISSRKGETNCDLVVMVRARAGLAQEARELLALRADGPEAVAEWMIMLGSNPLPPKLSRVPSFVDFRVKETIPEKSPAVGLTSSALARIPSVETIDIPVGEPSVLGVVESKEANERSNDEDSIAEKLPSKLSMGGGLQKKQIPQHWHALNTAIADKPASAPGPSTEKAANTALLPRSRPSAASSSSTAIQSVQPMTKSFKKVGSAHVPALQSNTEKLRYGPQIVPPVKEPLEITKQDSNRKTSNQDHILPPEKGHANADQNPKDKVRTERNVPKGEAISDPNVSQQTTSPVPSETVLQMPKVRGNTSPSIPLTDAIRDTWTALSGLGRKVVSQPSVPVVKDKVKTNKRQKESKDLTGHKSRHSMPELVDTVIEKDDKSPSPPPPPQHKEMPAPVLAPRSRKPILRPSAAQIKMDKESGRASFSPLRHEYTPSSASASDDSYSEPSSASEDDSQTSDEFHSEQRNRWVPTVPVRKTRYPQMMQQPQSAPTTGTRTLAPSDSASQGPYRRVASSAERPDAPKKKAVAMICAWSDSGVWEPLVENYCSIIVSPGLMEAFLIDEAHSGGGTNQRPLAAFELTPMVPLRRPTGIDINIRSPPTPESQIQTSNNIMFRSHSVAECEALYHMINWARCHNPTYIELERSRPPTQPPVTFSNQEAPRPRSWFSFGGGMKRRNSYRVGNIPPSSMGESQMTTNTMSSAISALKRLTKSSSFNVNRSSVRRRSGLTTDESLYSFSNGTGADSGKDTPPLSQIGMIPGADGPNVPPTSAAALNGGGMVHNMKIRLQIRQTGGWVTVGHSRLTILPAVKRSADSPEVSRPNSSGSDTGGNEETSRRASTTAGTAEPPQRQYRLSSSNYTPHRLHGGGREKRVVVTLEKDPSCVLLDATLGESCFEKISHFGIAVQVWRADDEVRSRGGVVMGQNTKYLFNFSNAKECAWVFQLVGKYRYSTINNN